MFDTSQPHLLLKGQISFVNSFGFLNADQYPLMQFFLIMFFVYLVVLVLWIRLMRKHGENKVSLHNYVCLLFFVTCLETALMYLEYNLYNESGKRTLSLAAFCVLFTAFRETLANFICLLIALGYGIVMNVLNRYSAKIFLLSFLFFIACAINTASFYINQHKALSQSVKVAMALPQFIMQIIFLIWIVSALIRTLTYLKVKRQEFKLAVMKRFMIVFTIGVAIYAVIRVAKIFFEVFNHDEEAWQNEHKFQIAWFLTYTQILFGTAWVFKPCEGSKMLAEVDEFLDETLTEIGTIDGDHNRVDSVAYAEELDRKMKQREQEMAAIPQYQFHPAATSAEGQMFPHLDQMHDEASHGRNNDIQIEFPAEVDYAEEKELDE